VDIQGVVNQRDGSDVGKGLDDIAAGKAMYLFAKML
jgi:hypothetical protein